MNLATSLRRTALLSLAFALPVLATADGHDPIAERQQLMSDTREALKPMIGMSRGQLDFDAATVSESLAVFAHTAANAGALFPEGSETGGETEAKATIWSDRAGFDQDMTDFADAVAAAQEANPQTLDEFKPVLRSVLGTCKACHDDYRIEKE